jgi:hypothetical protein
MSSANRDTQVRFLKKENYTLDSGLSKQYLQHNDVGLIFMVKTLEEKTPWSAM